jgi:hypothetical protein
MTAGGNKQASHLFLLALPAAFSSRFRHLALNPCLDPLADCLRGRDAKSTRSAAGLGFSLANTALKSWLCFMRYVQWQWPISPLLSVSDGARISAYVWRCLSPPS